MKRLLALAAFLLASSTAQAQYTVRIWRPHHPHRSGPRHRFDSRRLRQYRQEGEARQGDQREIRRATRRFAQQAGPAGRQGRSRAGSGPPYGRRRPLRPAVGATSCPASADRRDGARHAAHHHRQQCAGRYRRIAAAASSARTGTIAADPAGRAAACSGTVAARPGGRRRTARSGGTRPGSASTRSKFTGRRLADGREGRKGPHRAMRHQSLRLFGRRQVERQRRAGLDQYAARQGPEMERPDPRSQHRQHL